jgi:arsenite methyltransferase
MRRLVDPVLGQLRRPHGPLAPLTARILNVVNRPINRFAVGALQLSGHENVLDVGFGGGVGLTLVLNRLTTGRVAGIDISQEMVRRARESFGDVIAAGRLRVVGASVEAIPFADESFDHAYTVNTIFFWPDLPTSLSELHRVLRPEGRLVIAAPPAAFVMARAAGLAPPTGVAGIRDARRLVRDAGFVRVRLTGWAAASLILAER